MSQIQAGGVGLNIQSASVVILTEPQWKPTIEDQAIARCHRMGQVRSVDVHRLLAEHTVDQRMLEILATKAVLFDEYVRRSELKEHSPDAVDISDLKAAEEVGSQVEAERRIIEGTKAPPNGSSMTSTSPGQDEPKSGTWNPRCRGSLPGRSVAVSVSYAPASASQRAVRPAGSMSGRWNL